ncbi:hypothetical protein [Qipengyuania sphaerica]|uniref:hypothetical protein n=1 Tax=Qipengyuania sphaerica TaxID=2867243 RepID=UPI001C86C681|nr:hypothetical protein [Qipengyuania sphaerica]MBX7540900.1 hypothetical protein [Qipengyuania sphaerica]
MRTSGSIGSLSPKALGEYGVPLAGYALPTAMPAEFAAAWSVGEYVPEARVTYPARGLPVASLDKSPAEIFDLFSTARSAPANTYYVSPTGSDGAGNGTQGNPWRSMFKAVIAANASGQPAKVFVAAGDYGIFYNQAAQANYPTVDMAFIATGGRVVTGTWADFAAPTLDATYTNTYSFAYANCTRVIDLANVDRDGFHPDLKHVDSPAICNRMPGSWHQDGANIWINRADGAAVTAQNTRVLRSGVASWQVKNPVSIYLGGQDPTCGFDNQGAFSTGGGLHYQPTTLPASRKAVVVENCTFRYGGGVLAPLHTGNGISVHDLHGLALFSNCDSSNNTADGFNCNQASVANAKGHMITVNCRSVKLGLSTGQTTVAQSANAYTLHSDVLGIDLAGDYERGAGGTVRNIHSSLMWAAGSRFGHDNGDRMNGGAVKPTAVMINDTAQAWLDRCEIDAGPGVLGFYTDAGSAIRTRGMGPNRVNDVANGTVEAW